MLPLPGNEGFEADATGRARSANPGLRRWKRWPPRRRCLNARRSGTRPAAELPSPEKSWQVDLGTLLQALRRTGRGAPPPGHPEQRPVDLPGRPSYPAAEGRTAFPGVRKRGIPADERHLKSVLPDRNRRCRPPSPWAPRCVCRAPTHPGQARGVRTVYMFSFGARSQPGGFRCG